jgi:hypothetical protein
VDRVEGPVHHGSHGGADEWSGDASLELASLGVLARRTSLEVVREGECSSAVLTMGGNKRSNGRNGQARKGIDATMMVLGDNVIGALL